MPRQLVRNFGTAGQFNSTNNFVNLTTSTNFDANGSYISVEFWIYPFTTSGVLAIVAKGGGPSKGGWVIEISAGKILTAFKTATGTSSTSRQSIALIAPNVWTHVAVGLRLDTVTQANNSIIIVINGVISQGGLSQPVLPAVSTAHLKIGARAEDGSELSFWNGLIDEVKIYSGLLTIAQVQADMTSFTNPSTGVLGYWKFDDGSGSSLIDSSGNGITGTWNGTLGSQWSSNVYIKPRTQAGTRTKATGRTAAGTRTAVT